MTTARALSGQLLCRPARALAALAIALGYAVLYLWLSGDLAGGGSGGVAADGDGDGAAVAPSSREAWSAHGRPGRVRAVPT